MSNTVSFSLYLYSSKEVKSVLSSLSACNVNKLQIWWEITSLFCIGCFSWELSSTHISAVTVPYQQLVAQEAVPKKTFISASKAAPRQVEGHHGQMFLQQGLFSSVLSDRELLSDTALMGPRITSLLLTFLWISVELVINKSLLWPKWNTQSRL